MKQKHKYKRFLFSIVLMFPILLTAQVKDTVSPSAKIDSIYILQKKIYNESKNTPLSNKKYGIEVNIFRLLALSDAGTFSGSFSLFNVNRNSEIVFPVYYQRPQKINNLKEFTLDCHYRYFLRNTQNGFYLSGFARYAYLNGILGDITMLGSETTGPKGSVNKFGIGVGLGYRIFSYRGLYWGASFSFGRYLIGKSNKFVGGFLSLDDNQYILDAELLKFGWAF